MLIGQLSDIHLKENNAPAYRVADTESRLIKTGDYILRNNFEPDLFIITGDISDDGSLDSYARLKSFLEKINVPSFVIPGNHDHKENMIRVFADHSYFNNAVIDDGQKYLCYAIEKFSLRLIGLDTAIPGRHGGGLVPECLKWLESTLSEKPDDPTFLFMHHPPFASGIGHMDKEPFINRDKLAYIIRQNPQVVRLTCGHIHRSMTVEFGGKPAVVSPGIGMQIPVDLSPDAPSNFILEPPGVLFHFFADRWNDGPCLTTYSAMVEETPFQYGPRHPF
jgi:Icc protein